MSEEVTEEATPPRQSMSVGVGMHPITNQVGVQLIVQNGPNEVQLFLDPENSLGVAGRIQSQATIAMVMQAQAQLEMARQQHQQVPGAPELWHPNK